MSIGPNAATHFCPKMVCGRRVKNSQFACPKHWFELSHPLRRRITFSWATGDLDGHAEAVAEAMDELNQ